MVARGDLGVEMPLERVPGIQKQITRACRRAGKPVVVATQMLESMIAAPVPTRAEVSDVATAVFEGCDAVMLSAESASGAFPVEAVATMDRVATEVERDPNYVNILRAQRTEPEATSSDAISAATRQIAETLNLAAICCYTASGNTAVRASRERPEHADPGAVAGGLHRPPPVAGLGAALRLRRGAGQSRRHGHPCQRHGPQGGPGRPRRPRHHHRRRAARAPPARPTCCASPMSRPAASAANRPRHRGQAPRLAARLQSAGHSTIASTRLGAKAR